MRLNSQYKYWHRNLEYEFSRLNDSLLQFDRVCKLFCEDPATSQSDEFFGVFDYFLGSFNEAKNENENIRRKREEEEKIAKQHQEVKLNLRPKLDQKKSHG